MKQYVYYACGENVESIRFFDSVGAWDFVEKNYGYDCVVEMMGVLKMIKNKTYHNFMIIMNRLIDKGYDKEEAENLTHKCFDNSEQDGRSPEVFESMILRKSEYDKAYN